MFCICFYFQIKVMNDCQAYDSYQRYRTADTQLGLSWQYLYFFFFSFWIEQIVMFLMSVIIALIYGLINTESSAKWASVRCIDPNIQEMMILIDATEVKITRYNWRPPSAYALHCCINLVRPYKIKLGFLAYICISCTSHTLYSSFQTYPWYHSI